MDREGRNKAPSRGGIVSNCPVVVPSFVCLGLPIPRCATSDLPRIATEDSEGCEGKPDFDTVGAEVVELKADVEADS
jgi:hypothetical protein